VGVISWLEGLTSRPITAESLVKALQSQNEELRVELGEEIERKTSAIARLIDSLEQIKYLRGQIELYQKRLGLIIEERPKDAEKVMEPIARKREPFHAAAQRIETERTKKYWEARAAKAADAVTSETSPVTEDK
jgi:hypothetical protein